MSFKEIQTRTIFEGYKITLKQVDLELADGRTHTRELIDHPGASVMLGLTNDGKMVFIRNDRFAAKATMWEIPAGTREEGEDPKICADRELREESGYRAAKIEHLGSFYSTPGFCNELMHAYLCTELEYVGQDLDDEENITVELLEVDRVRQMMLSGEIADAKTLATLALYFLKKDQM